MLDLDGLSLYTSETLVTLSLRGIPLVSSEIPNATILLTEIQLFVFGLQAEKIKMIESGLSEELSNL
jgi:hypothetical protein